MGVEVDHVEFEILHQRLLLQICKVFSVKLLVNVGERLLGYQYYIIGVVAEIVIGQDWVGSQ